MSEHKMEKPPKIRAALEGAEREQFTRPAPKSARAQMKFLLTRAKGSAGALAARLGVSRRTVERYCAGQLTTPQKRLRATLAEESTSEWQPQVRAQIRERAATAGGMEVECQAYFGFVGASSSDSGRNRYIRTAISPTLAAQILAKQEAGATDQELHPLVARAITESYVTDWGTRCPGLQAHFTNVEWLKFHF